MLITVPLGNEIIHNIFDHFEALPVDPARIAHVIGLHRAGKVDGNHQITCGFLHRDLLAKHFWTRQSKDDQNPAQRGNDHLHPAAFENFGAFLSFQPGGP